MDWLSWLGTTSDAIGVLGAVLGAIFALGGWIQTRRLQTRLREEEERINQRIMLILEHDEVTIELPFEMRRVGLTRAEVLGLIGMIPMKIPGERFTLGYLSQPAFLQQINEIQQGSGNVVLTIPCTEAEIEQFDFQNTVL